MSARGADGGCVADDLVYRLRKRAEIRRQISTRKSVQEGKPDRIADLLDEAAGEIERMRADEDRWYEGQKRDAAEIQRLRTVVKSWEDR